MKKQRCKHCGEKPMVFYKILTLDVILRWRDYETRQAL